MLGLPFHHVGIACSDIEAAAAYVLKAYAVVSDTGTVFDPLQRAHVRLFNEGLPGAIELVSGPMVEAMLKRNMTYYHICYRTGDLERTMLEARKLGALPTGDPVPAVLFGGRRIVFMLTELGLVEFLEDAAPA